MNGIWWLVLAAGSVAALPKAQKHNQMKLPSFRGVAEVRASIPGRMRLYMPAVSEFPEAAKQMRTSLIGTGVIHSVQAETRTGSVLICYDESKVQAPVVMGAAMKLMGLDEKVKSAPVGKLREGIRTLMRGINAGILDATNGILDAKTVAAGALTIAAIRSKTRMGWAAPGAITLLWWASNLFGARDYEQDQ